MQRATSASGTKQERAMFVSRPPWWLLVLLRTPTLLYRVQLGWYLAVKRPLRA